MTPRLGRACRIGASAGLLIAAAFLVDWGELLTALRRFPVGLAAAGAAACALTLLLLTVRWWLMIRRFAPGGFLLHAGHFWMGTVAGLFTPAAIGADVYRVAVLRGGVARRPDSRDPISTDPISTGPISTGAAAAGVVLRERLIGLLGYCLFYLGCRAAAPAAPASLDAAAAVLAAAAAGLAAMLAAGPSLGRLLGRLLERQPPGARQTAIWGGRLAAMATAAGTGSPAALAVSLGLTLAACAVWAAALGLFLAGLGERPGAAAVGMIAVLAELARWLPISIQGVGVREAAAAFGVERFGGDPAIGFAAGGLVYLLHAAVCALAGALGAWTARGKGGES